MSMSIESQQLLEIEKRLASASNIIDSITDLRSLIMTGTLRREHYAILSNLISNIIDRVPPSIQVLRVAVLGNYTTQPIATAVRCALIGEGILAEVYEAPFGTYLQEIISHESDLYAFHPDLVIIAIGFSEIKRLLYISVSDEALKDAVEREVDHWITLWNLLGERIGKTVIQHLFVAPEEEYLGIAERRVDWSPSRFVEMLNERFMVAAPSFIHWVDVDRLAARVGRQNWHDPRFYHHGKFGFSPRFLTEYTLLLSAALRGAIGKTKKALIVDLDNTLWGGVIGDDGMDGICLGPDTAEGEAHQSFCNYIKRLGQRGVILGVCSKNEFDISVEVFNKHPHMPLKLKDFAIVCCNWDDKASNLVKIAQELNIDISSLVFVDDNPAECELIRQSLPDVYTIQMDGDPALFIRKLDQNHLFDSQGFSDEDMKRTESYQARAKSKSLKAELPNLDTYLASLEMRAQIKVAGPAEYTRLAQMEMKTNQFNLTTRRLSQSQIEIISESPDKVILAIFLADRFADHGLVSYVALEILDDKLVITDWLMSCRVFSRTLEQFTVNRLVKMALEKNVQCIEARFAPTAKNKVMNGLFMSLGFSCVGLPPKGPWQYEISQNQTPLKCFITE